MTGVLLGMALALFGLLPGVHVAAWLPVVFVWLGGEQALICGGVFVGASAMLGILQGVYHPVAQSRLASAEAPAKLAHAGFGRDAVVAHARAVWVGLGGVVLLNLVALVGALQGADVLGLVAGAIKPISPWVLLGVLGWVVARAGKPVPTLLVVLTAGALGFISFQVVKGEAVLVALLGGLFTLPSAWALLWEPGGAPMPRDMAWPFPVRSVTGWEWRGVLAGMATGFLAGVGTGSLVSVLRRDDMDLMSYLRLNAAADTANNAFALLLFAGVGSTRSGVAAAMAAAGGRSDGLSLVIVTVALVTGVVFGGWLLVRVEGGYRMMATRLPNRWIGGLLLVVTLGMTWWSLGWQGLAVAGAAAQLSSLAKSRRVPNQALLSALIGPALISELGLVVGMAGVFSI